MKLGILLLVASLVTGLLIAVLFFRGNNRADENAAAAQQARVTAQRALIAVTALCAQREDLDARVQSEARRLQRSRKFLRENPHGTPGISESLIRAAINDDADTLMRSRRTRKNLSILDC